jgi:hypothetical protein
MEIKIKLKNIEEKINFINTEIDKITTQLLSEKDSGVINRLNNEYDYYSDLLDDYNTQYEYYYDLPTDSIIHVPDPTYNFTNNRWQYTDNITRSCNNSFAYCDIFIPSGITEIITDTLLISDFNFNIPTNALIQQITLKIKKKAKYDDSLLTNIRDYKVVLIDPYGIESFNMANNTNPAYYSWSTTLTEYEYTSDDWGMNLDPIDINNIDFKASISAIIYNLDSGDTQNNIAYIDCVCMEITYKLPGMDDNIEYISSEYKNTVFDNNLKNFGVNSEVIISKINEDESPLKITDTNMDKSIFPMIDEFGYSYEDIFIFKSTWDIDYYTRTKKESE